MSIWKTAPVDQMPEVSLENWRVFEVKSLYWDGRTRHFMGYNPYDCEGRVSSAIDRYDPAIQQGISKSGRVYKLLGEPGYNREAEYVWSRWCEINHIEDQRDVTAEVLNAERSE